MEIKQALAELRKEKKRKFEQTVDLLISLKGIDLRKESINAVVQIPHKIREKKVCGFLEVKNEAIKTITKPEFDKYKDKKALKELVREYDFFIANAKLMPSVATTFGKTLGPTGKMPSPQLGVVMVESKEAIQGLLEKIAKSVKLRAKEPSIKIAVGRENMTDEQIMENAQAVYAGVLNVLPSKKENIRKVMLKFTMSKPVVLEMK